MFYAIFPHSKYKALLFRFAICYSMLFNLHLYDIQMYSFIFVISNLVF